MDKALKVNLKRKYVIGAATWWPFLTSRGHKDEKAEAQGREILRVNGSSGVFLHKDLVSIGEGDSGSNLSGCIQSVLRRQLAPPYLVKASTGLKIAVHNISWGPSLFYYCYDFLSRLIYKWRKIKFRVLASSSQFSCFSVSLCVSLSSFYLTPINQNHFLSIEGGSESQSMEVK